jgi:hypothetical protein
MGRGIFLESRKSSWVVGTPWVNCLDCKFMEESFPIGIIGPSEYRCNLKNKFIGVISKAYCNGKFVVKCNSWIPRK